MQFNGVVQRKLSLLDDQVQQIKKHTKDISFEAFSDSWMLKSMAERALQVAVEIMIDIAERVIAFNNAGPAATAADAMNKLQTLGVIESAETYRSMVRFRNMIVHEYEEVEPQIMWDILKNRLDDFLRFRDEIDRAE